MEKIESAGSAWFAEVFSSFSSSCNILICVAQLSVVTMKVSSAMQYSGLTFP